MMPRVHDTLLLRVSTIGHGGAARVLAAAKHNLREIGGDHIDKTRTPRNQVVEGPATAAGVAERAACLAHEAGITFRRKDNTRLAEVIFGLPAATQVDADAYFHACLRWLKTVFGGPVVVSAVIHHDAANPHLHALMLPMRDGCWLGGSVFGKRADLLALRKEFEEKVGRSFGVRQAPHQLGAADRAATGKAVVHALRAAKDPVLKSVGWSLVRDLIAADPRAWAELLEIPVVRTLRTLTQIMTSAGKGAHGEDPGNPSCAT
jgi:hypothetical protein